MNSSGTGQNRRAPAQRARQTLYNNIWGGGRGPQTIWANSYSNWGVWADHPNTGG